MRGRLAPSLFEDDDRKGARAQRSSPVEKAEVSESAKAKAESGRAPDGLLVHSFTTLLADLATLTLRRGLVSPLSGLFQGFPGGETARSSLARLRRHILGSVWRSPFPKNGGLSRPGCSQERGTV